MCPEPTPDTAEPDPDDQRPQRGCVPVLTRPDSNKVRPNPNSAYRPFPSCLSSLSPTNFTFPVVVSIPPFGSYPSKSTRKERHYHSSPVFDPDTSVLIILSLFPVTFGFFFSLQRYPACHQYPSSTMADENKPVEVPKEEAPAATTEATTTETPAVATEAKEEAVAPAGMWELLKLLSPNGCDAAAPQITISLCANILAQ